MAISLCNNLLERKVKNFDMKQIRKILIANRGEIALRVMRTCREMGIQTVSIFSNSDRHEKHVSYADESIVLDSNVPSESYLSIKKIVEIAKSNKVDAVHPGYGFLSENPKFASALQEAGIILIGPKASSMKAMASKTNARRIMQEAKVPVVPGEAYSEEAVKKIGLPVMLKAAYGGGGKGMRLVHEAKELASAYRMAKEESEKFFGNGEIYVEKFLTNPRHIEVQILADGAGNVLTFPERECSVQRRHQKVIEESPSPFVDSDMRQSMCRIAAQAATAVNYVGAGTIEFLVDANKNFYFMEMNTRLQVEHPITEMICGVDLVREQIKIAQGKRLPEKFSICAHKGWAIEARICAEDPSQNFMPSPGKITNYVEPSGPFVRVDSALFSGQEITVEYDPMIAKVIGHGSDRASAIARLQRALGELRIVGLETNQYFIQDVLTLQEFNSGNYDTGILGTLSDWRPKHDEGTRLAAMLAATIFASKSNKNKAEPKFTNQNEFSAWKSRMHFRHLPSGVQ